MEPSPWVRKILWEGNSNSFQYYCLENSIDRVWQATVHAVAEIRTRLSNSTITSTSFLYWQFLFNYLTKWGNESRRRVTWKAKLYLFFLTGFLSLATLLYTKNPKLKFSCYVAIVMSQINKHWINSFTLILMSFNYFPTSVCEIGWPPWDPERKEISY